MTIAFWNTCKSTDHALIAAFAREQDASVLILAEAAIRTSDLLVSLNDDTESLFQLDPGFSKRLLILSRFPKGAVAAIGDYPGVAIRHYTPPIGGSFLLAAVHLPSKLHYSDHEQGFHATTVASYIRRAEEAVGHCRTVVIGDFNMNPFEPGLVGAHGLHAVMDRRVATAVSRRVQECDYPYFYNPMWSRLGDLNNRPSGTYFYRESTPMAFFWNTFDQVLIRPSLLPYFSDDSVTVVSAIHNQSLLDADGRPNKLNGSDHLPILFRMKRQEGSEND